MLMKTMFRCGMLLFLLTNCSEFVLLGQNNKDKNGITIQCTLPKIVHDNIGLKAEIIINNNSDSAAIVYKEIVEGIFSNGLVNNFTNFSLIVQKK
jgi:hypothetical protein